MGIKNNYIELNGKRYNTASGKLMNGYINDFRQVDSHKLHPKTSMIPKSIDSIRRPNNSTHTAKLKTTQIVSKIQPKASNFPALAMDIKRRATKGSVKAHHPMRSITLMRHAVKKPVAPSLRPHLKTQFPASLAPLPSFNQIIPKLSFYQVGQERIARAKEIAKSPLISHFPVLTAPSISLSQSPVPQLALPNHTGQNSIPNKVLAAHHHNQNPNQLTNNNHLGPQKRSMDIFERALAQANSHEQPAYKPPRHSKVHAKRKRHLSRRGLNISAIALAILLIVGFIGYQNKANISLRIADARAGINANLPSNKPSGFSIGNFQYSPGLVAISFHGINDNRAFTLSQKASNWDSQTLLDNYVASNNKSYQSLQVDGRTIYIYGNNDAVWVNNGLLYKITDNGNLSTNQIINIATSI